MVRYDIPKIRFVSHLTTEKFPKTQPVESDRPPCSIRTSRVYALDETRILLFLCQKARQWIQQHQNTRSVCTVSKA